MRVLVTGGCGFIGSNFLNKMIVNYPNYFFVNVDCLNYCANIENVKHRNEKNYKFIKGDITSLDLITHILNEYNIDTVVHFAAQSHVDTSFTNSFQYTRDNVMGTHTLLEASKQYGKLQKFIHVSTDEVYGDTSEIKSDETSLLAPTNPYAATKAAAEMLVMSYYKSFKLPILITRGNNTYGPNQYPEKVIPKFIQQIIAGKPCTIQGKGTALRNFIHVFDVVSAFDAILHNGVVGEIYNIGGDENTEISVYCLAETLTKLIRGNFNPYTDIQLVADRDFNDQRYWISNNKIKEFGWKPTVSLKEGLQNTIEFYTRG
jgi:dTDP-glucose 4,6-dehydratase